MTVVRRDQRIFDAPREKVVEAVRKILSKGHQRYVYAKIYESSDGSLFTMRIRPVWRWLLSTPMSIRVEGEGSCTTVSVETRSQFFIQGDVFDMYRQYIRDVLYALESSLENNT